jgi:hypothetical protein
VYTVEVIFEAMAAECDCRPFGTKRSDEAVETGPLAGL